MKLKKQTDQAIRILVHLSTQQQPTIGKDLAVLVGASNRYIPHIMQQLRNNGLITSLSGVSGGYELLKNPKDITLLDVMKATGDNPQINCYDKNDVDGFKFDQTDTLIRNYSAISNKVEKFFDSLTIRDIANQKIANTSL